jgi:hypothetical protein
MYFRESSNRPARETYQWEDIYAGPVTNMWPVLEQPGSIRVEYRGGRPYMAVHLVCVQAARQSARQALSRAAVATGEKERREEVL